MPESATSGRRSAAARYAVIAGSGFGGTGEDGAGRRIHTRFGEPSAALRTLRFGGCDVCLLLRHGEAHDVPPHAINYRANLAALAQLGVRDVLALNTVGSIASDALPGQLAVPSQLIDYSWGRAHTIYDARSARLDHVDFTQPFSARLRSGLLDAAAQAGIDCRDGGVYGVTQGPRLETAAEVDRYERDGVDYLGMTGMPEASLARELGMAYAMLSLVVNVAAGRGAQAIHADIEENTGRARRQALAVLDRYFTGLAGRA